MRTYIHYFFIILLLLCINSSVGIAQYNESFDRFSQTMSVKLDDSSHNFVGTATTVFVNATNDTLRQVFYHAVFNAFQPNSEMHKRASVIGPNRLRPEVFARLQPHETGKLEMLNVLVNGKTARIERTGTIIKLDDFGVLLPRDSVVIFFQFVGQVPIQIRRSGRDNSQGVRYSMAQWFPKLCQYDQSGWHNNQFIAREFYGVWGKYDVSITLPAKYIVGASGTLQNPQQVGHGYEQTVPKGKVMPDSSRFRADSLHTWRFVAEPVHDFAWVADANYVHEFETRNGLTVHALYKQKYGKNWENMTDWCHRTIEHYSKHYVPYAYKHFTSSMAGDGGMEYPQLIMLRSSSDIPSLLGVTTHEIGHQWFYGMVANNETKHAWMDEGFTTYIENKCQREVFAREMKVEIPWYNSFFLPPIHERREDISNYLTMPRLGYNQPMGISHDRFAEDRASGLVYTAGASLLHQLEYSFGAPMLDSLMKRYATTWRFRHPYPKDFEKLCEEVFGQRLDDMFETYMQLRERPDYTITEFTSNQNTHPITYKPIRQNGTQPLWETNVTITKHDVPHIPLNLTLIGESGLRYTAHIPSDVRFVDVPPLAQRSIVLPMWYWTNPRYTTTIATPEKIARVTLDTTGLLDDDYLSDNTLVSSLFKRPFEIGWWKRYDSAKISDVYGISIRPTAWYFENGGTQFGLRFDGSADGERYQTTLGAYYNLRTNKVDWQVGFEDEFAVLGRLARIKMQAYSMDGADYGGIHLTKDYRPDRYTTVSTEVFTTSFEIFNIARTHPLLARYRTPQPARQGMNDNFFYASPLSSLAFMRAMAQYQYQSPSTALTAKLIVAAQERSAGLQSVISLRQTLFSNILESNIPLRFNLLSVLGTTYLPEQQQYSINELPIADQINNIPLRSMAFLASSYNVPIVLPFSTMLVGIRAGLSQSLHTGNIILGDMTLSNVGISIPVLGALRPALYTIGGVIARAIDAPYVQILESGISVKVKLADILPWQGLLWMFSEETSISMYYPLYTYSSSTTTPVIKNITVGISVGMP